jgi:hypothetical protein
LITEDSAVGDQELKKVLLTKILPKGKGCVAVHVMHSEGMEVQLHTFFASALDGGDLSASRPGCFIHWKLTTGVKVKVTFTLEQATKAQRRSRGITLLFL